MEEEENRHPPVREDPPARGGEKPTTESSLDADWDQSGAFCAGQVIILKALQQAVGSGLTGELQDPANEKDGEYKRTSRRKWCRSSRSEGLGGSWLGTGDPALVSDRSALMGEVLETPAAAAAAMPALAGVLDYLELTCHLPQGVESSTGTQVVYGDEEMEEVELVAEVRLGDVGTLSGVLRRNQSWRMQKSVCVGSATSCWRGSRPCPIGHLSLPEQSYPLDPHRAQPIMDKATWTSALARSELLQFPKTDRTSPSPCLGMALGTGMGVSNGGQQRPQGATGRESESQQRSQPPPASSLDKTNSSTSSSSSCSSSTSSVSRHQGLPGEGGGGGSENPCPPMHSPDLDIYDPFHPTDEDNLNGDFGFGDSPHKEAEGGRHDQKYDPFDPTGSNPSSSASTPSPEEDDDDDDDEDDDHDQHPPDMSHSISRISETLAGIYDENSLSQDFPSSDKGQEDSEPEAEPGRDYESESVGPTEASEAKEPPGADSTLPEELPPEQMESKAPEPRRRVFVVDLAPKGRLDAEAKPQLEGKVSLEVVTVGNAKLRSGEKTSKGSGHHRTGRRSSMEWDGSGGGDSEIEEGEIVQPEDERYSPIRLFRSRCRPAEQRTLRVVEGDDFLSLHADSDDEGALQIDFSESQPDPRWKGVDLRRKILTQRRERFHRAPSPLPPPPPPPAPKRPASKSHSGSSSGSCKKSKRERKRSRERKASKTKEPYASSWNPKKKSKSRSKSKERRHSHHRGSRSRSHHRTSRSWSPSISTSLSAVGSSHTSAERRKSRRSKSKEKRRGRRSRSRSSSRAHRSRHKDKHRGDGGRKKKKRSRSHSREKHPSHRISKDKEREVHLLEEPKSEKVLMERRRDARTVVPPSIQDLNDNDLFTIKRTITVNHEEKMDGLLETPERAKREVLYDSEGMSFDACFSDREPTEESKSAGVRLVTKEDTIPSRKDKRSEEDMKQKVPKEKERKRAYLEDRPGARDKYKKKLKEGPPCSEQQELPKAEKKARPDRDKSGKKIKAGSHKESGKLGSGRKVKLQSKVAVLIREGVSSTTSVKEVGSIGVKFSRDKESRSPFLKSEEKVLMVGASAAGQGEMVDVKEPGFKPKKVKGLKAKLGVKKLKGLKPKGASEPKKKKKLKVKTGLKKSKADSCSQGASSPLRVKEEPSWSGSEKSEGTAKPPSPQPLAPGQELTPDSQTVDSSCKTPDVSFLPEDPPAEQPRVPEDEPEADSLSETKEEQPQPQPPHPPRSLAPPPAPMSWNLQGGVDCTSGVLALTALLFKMEEANLASRAKAQELIQATNQILTHTKPSASLGPSQPPAPPAHPPVSHLAGPPVSYLLQGSLPLGGCGSTPTTPTGTLPGTLSQAPSGPPSAGLFASSGTDLGSTSSEGRGDSDKYLKKLHTQERAVEEVKLAIKPYYQKKEITKDEYKDILRKAVHKICHSKSGEINPVKVNNLVKAYVQRYKYFRKHGRKMDEEPGPPREIGGLDKSGLPMPPL
ncbi:splicing factor, arginine/serine-rich 19 isoform X2 [Hemicordylus capensis]|nr:splicing factor, arginine/serine-rich 19 isoform X2 [Hemicordylus capensis]XP_053118651.1 splicing factor, arginine/serine-rich 19 isoform X2 [Hemicordylus capensis]XP_053118652.1 splicing factor, arginine/serine-rich 19 isoform X2 [Hemicordylus capensis]XP_053118653.1 splicing factor, arginine/serine-rich 19 isoform X2 [Hemicordylus capensis]